LLKHLETCRLKDIPQHAESIVIAVNADTKKDFILALENRMTASQTARVKKVIQEAEKRTTSIK